MSTLAQLSLQRVSQALPEFAGTTLPEKLAAGRAAAEASLSKYAGKLSFDVAEAQAVARRVDAWAQRNEQDLSEAMLKTSNDLPAAMQLAMGSSIEVQQFLIASFTLAAAGMGPWSSGAVARSVEVGEHAEAWAMLDAESRLQTFGLIVRMEADGDLEAIFRPPSAAAGLGGWPVALIIVATVIFAAAVVTYVYLNRRLELNNRLMRELCERAQKRGDRATVEECIKATRDLQVSAFDDVGSKLLTGLLIVGAGYLALTFGPRLLSGTLGRSKPAYQVNESSVPVLTPKQSRARVAELQRRGCEVSVEEMDGYAVVMKRCP